MKKLKGSLKSVKMKYLLFMYAASLFVLLPFRVYQLLAVTETKTGFFVKGDITGYIIYALLFTVTALFLALSFLSREVPSPRLPKGRNAPLGIASLVFAAALLYDCAEFCYKVYPGSGYSFDVFSNALKSSIDYNGGVLAVFRLVFAVASIIWFVIFAVGNLGGKAHYAKYKILALAPVCWAIIRTLTYLSSAYNYLRVSELLFEIAMLAFLVPFFLTQARISTGIFTVDSMWGIYGYGFSAAVFAAIITVPRVIMTALGRENALGFKFEPSDFGALIFILTYIFASFGIGFEGSVKERRLVSEIALPEDGVVVRKGDNRKLSENTDKLSASENTVEIHGIFKVEEETFEITREEKEKTAFDDSETGNTEPGIGDASKDGDDVAVPEIAEEPRETVEIGTDDFVKPYGDQNANKEVLTASEEIKADGADENDDDEGVSLLLDEYAAEDGGFEGAEEADEEYCDVETSGENLENADSQSIDIDDDKAEAREGFSESGESFFDDSEDDESDGALDDGENIDDRGGLNVADEESNVDFVDKDNNKKKRKKRGGFFKKKKADGEELEDEQAESELLTEEESAEEYASAAESDSEELQTDSDSYDGEAAEIENTKKRKKRGGFFKKKKAHGEDVEDESTEAELLTEEESAEEYASTAESDSEELQTDSDSGDGEAAEIEYTEKRKKRGGFFKRKKEYDDSFDDEPISAVSLKEVKARKKN